jgi:hypothetical protein
MSRNRVQADVNRSRRLSCQQRGSGDIRYSTRRRRVGLADGGDRASREIAPDALATTSSDGLNSALFYPTSILFHGISSGLCPAYRDYVQPRCLFVVNSCN